MHFFNTVSALGFAALAHAAALAPVSRAAPFQNYTITVGMNKTNTFSPSYVNATTGDTLIFEFLAGNHTLTQSSFQAPCVDVMGVDSGFIPVGSSEMPTTFEFTLTNDSTMWFYCRQGTHCKQGMVFALNPTATETFAMFQQAAMGSDGTTGTSSMAVPSPSATTTTTKNSGVMMGNSIVGVVGSVGLAWALL